MNAPAAPAPAPIAIGNEVTVLDGSSFCRSGRSGDIAAKQSQGVFVKDTRIISVWKLLLDDEPLVPLSVISSEPFEATFVTRAAPREPTIDPSVVVERRRMMAADMREDITVTNYGIEPLGATLRLMIDADFADLFAVKDGRPIRRGTVRRTIADDHVKLTITLAGQQRGVRVNFTDATVSHRLLTWRIAVPPQGTWTTTVTILPVEGTTEADPSFPVDRPVEATEPSRRLQQWHMETPTVRCEDPALQAAVDRSVDDLGSLRIHDPAQPDLPILAAGAPWFMTLFGRDSLLTSMMCLPWDLNLARGALAALACRQGTEINPHSEAEPGKILHEIRLGLDESTALGSSSLYYGSVDATPLFVILLGEAARWGLPEEERAQLTVAADRAIEWIEHYGDVDGDGFVEYQRKTDRGLANQGWKDSFDSINDRQGRLAHGAIALAEVQGYVYAAYRSRADLARLAGDEATAKRCDMRADTLRTRFDEAFWLDEFGYYAIALDGDKEPVDGLASNQAHCLWSGIVSDERAELVVQRLVSPELFSGWGIRTLASDMGAYNPISYHNGSVWPHDNALAVTGMARYGYWDAAGKVATALIEASQTSAGRLPELFCGFSREEIPVPVSYPTACSPQAWAAAAPLAIVSALLDLQPDATSGTVRARNRLPEQWGRVRIDGIRINGDHTDVDSATLD